MYAIYQPSPRPNKFILICKILSCVETARDILSVVGEVWSLPYWRNSRNVHIQRGRDTKRPWLGSACRWVRSYWLQSNGRWVSPAASNLSTRRSDLDSVSTATVTNTHILTYWQLQDGSKNITVTLNKEVLRGGVMVKALDLWSRGRGFESRPFHFHVTTLGKLFTHMCLCHQAV